MYMEEIDIPSAKERFMGNEALYKKFLFQLPDKGMMEELNGFINSKDVVEGFKSAHTLKGVVGNLSLNRLMQALDGVVEALRSEELPEAGDMERLEEAYNAAMDAIMEIKDNDITLF